MGSALALCSYPIEGTGPFPGPMVPFEFRSGPVSKFSQMAHIGGMLMNTFKLAALAGLVLISGGAWPNPRYGAAIAIGACIVAAP